MTTNPLDLIEARANAATKGPWDVTAFDSGHSRFEMSVSICTRDVGDTICDMDGLARSQNMKWATSDGFTDAVFIAHAREDVPKLVAALRAVEAVHRNEHRDHLGRKSETPTERGGFCYGCGWYGGDACPMITAIREALG